MVVPVDSRAFSISQVSQVLPNSVAAHPLKQIPTRKKREVMQK